MQWKAYLSTEKAPVLRLLGWDRPWKAGVFSMTADIPLRARQSVSYLDSLLLTTARRIYTLEHNGKAPDKMADLVTAGLLSELPKDRFGDGKALCRESEGRYYSVGPDKVDQRGEVVYDSTNGSMSVGDIVLSDQ